MRKSYRRKRRFGGVNPVLLCGAFCAILVIFFLARQGLSQAIESGSDASEFWEGMTSDEGRLTKEERDGAEPLFLQTDSRWSDCKYGDSTISISGCAPCCLAMTAVALTGNRKITPGKVARYSEKNGFYVEGKGSLWMLIPEAGKHFGLSVEELPLSRQHMIRVLENGGKIICAMGPGDFTTEGHFIEIYQVEENGFRLHDSNSLERSRKLWTYEEISGQIRNLWGLSR